MEYNINKHMNICSYEKLEHMLKIRIKVICNIYYMEDILMKKTYKIEVDCANCANKMEEAAKKTEGVLDASVNFMALKMNVIFEEGCDHKEVMKQVLKNCKKVEDDCEIYIS